jgi:hypothetical protein
MGLKELVDETERKAIRAAALEEAAKVCDERAAASDRIIKGAGDAARADAAAIRALKEAR